MRERRQTIETGFDGTRWYNMLVGGYVVASFRATAAEAELQGRAMAQARRASHVVKNEDGDVVSNVDYRS